MLHEGIKSRHFAQKKKFILKRYETKRQAIQGFAVLEVCPTGKCIPGQLVSAVDRVTQNGGIHYTEQRDIAYKEWLCMSTRHN